MGGTRENVGGGRKKELAKAAALDVLSSAVLGRLLVVDTPASAQMTESPINTNAKSGGMRVEGRVTRPPKSTPTKRRYAAMMWYDEE